MNKKIALIMVAAVAVILPAVAVADVLVMGQLTLESFHHHTAFEFQAGPNYAAANSTNSIGWIAQNDGTMGTLDLEGSFYVQTEMINVIDLNMTVSNAAAPHTFMGLYLNVSSSDFPSGTIMVISTSQISFTTLESTVVTSYTAGDAPIALNAASASSVLAIDLSQNPHVLITGFVPTQTLYISFLLGPGMYAGSSAMLTGQFVVLA